MQLDSSLEPRDSAPQMSADKDKTATRCDDATRHAAQLSAGNCALANECGTAEQLSIK
jgi:hypothetical protein